MPRSIAGRALGRACVISGPSESYGGLELVNVLFFLGWLKPRGASVSSFFTTTPEADVFLLAASYLRRLIDVRIGLFLSLGA
jgi:hypothetical protein